MSSDPQTPDAVADAVSNHWVDTKAPPVWRPYLRLSRVERPIGSWLLLLPCWWGVMLAILWDGQFRLFDLWIAAGCAIGSVLMRGAGCTWNDITDRDIDGKVARTARRPIPSGAVTVRQALAWAGLQSFWSLSILLTFNGAARWLGVIALVPVLIYPFAKRFTWWPQVFLGIAFNWGALLAFAAHAGTLAWPAIMAYAAGIAWTLFYDTIYAHQDAEDDALIGVKSTARLFADDTTKWLRRFMVAAVLLMALAVMTATAGRGFAPLVVALGAPWVLGWHMVWQLTRFDADDGPGLLRLFRSNRNTGLFPLIFLVLAALL